MVESQGELSTLSDDSIDERSFEEQLAYGVPDPLGTLIPAWSADSRTNPDLDGTPQTGASRSNTGTEITGSCQLGHP